jgi:Ca2+-binding EF-hand superfamily protein
MMKSLAWNRLLMCLLAGSTSAFAVADEPQKTPTTPAEAHRREVEEVRAALRDSYPDRPEWVDMLTSILVDEPMGPDFGWFRTAKTQTRFGWESTLARLDRDHDGRIVRREFAGSDAHFARLDRDRDGVLTARDFDFSGSSLSPSPGALVFARLDRNGNGKVTREELDAFFRSADRDGQGFLSLADLQEAFAPPPAPQPGSGGPSKATLILGLFRQELGALESGPKLGEPAPDFTLQTHNRLGVVKLSEHRGKRPVVLIFGSFT